MNKPSKLVLTEAHVKVLEALREAQPMGITQLSKFPGLSRRSALSDVCADLLEHGLLVADKQPSPPGGGSPIRAYSLSMAGCRALAAHKRLQDAARMKEGLVKGPTYNIFEHNYNPPTHHYYRNNGNVHISSAGVRC